MSPEKIQVPRVLARLGLLLCLLPLSVLAETGPVPIPGRTGEVPVPVPGSTGGVPLPVVFLEETGSSPGPGSLPEYRRIPPGDPRAQEAREHLANEAADFLRHLLARLPGTIPQSRELSEAGSELFIALRKGGNYARLGLVLSEGETRRELPRQPYVVLAPTSGALSLTALHEGGHLAHTLARRCSKPESGWTAFVHTTFAVTDRLTALSEGYAIHLEALWGHFGSDPARRAHYHRSGQVFGPEAGTQGEFFFPVKDLWSYSQSWARYASVRDGLPAFQGHVYPGDPMRSQLDPARDRRHLKSPGQMLASEGVVASVLFHLASQRAQALGAEVGGGLRQPGVMGAELELLRALRHAHDRGGLGIDLLHVLESYRELFPDAGELALDIFLDLTRGVSADPDLGRRWSRLYDSSTHLDPGALRSQLASFSEVRSRLQREAREDPSVLRRGLGPVLPVRAVGIEQDLPVFGQAIPLEFDLNAFGRAELAALRGLGARQRLRLREESLRGPPFASYQDFRSRTGIALDGTCLEPVETE